MSPATRRRVSVACIVAGTLALLAALPLAYLDRNVFEARGFADNAAATLQDSAVRAQISGDLTRAIVSARPQAVSAQPVLRSAIDAVLQSAQAAALVRSAAAETHKAVFSQTQGSVVIDLANLAIVAIGYVDTRNPGLAKQLEAPREVALKLADRTLTVRAVRLAETVRVLVLILPLAAIALYMAGLFVDPDRRRAALDVGTSLFLVGVVSFAGYLIAGGLLLAGTDGAQRDAVAGIWRAFMRDFIGWCALTALAGVIVAAAAASVTRELDPARLPAFLWGRITQRPDATWKLVVGAFGLIVAGIAIIGDPSGAVRLAASISGAWLVFAGVVTLLRLLVGPAPAAGTELRARALVRRLAPALVAAIAIALAGGVLVGTTLESRAKSEPKVASSPGCNGAVALCDRRLDEVTFPATHNAEASAQAGFLNPNHGIDILSQLDLGVRGLLIDAYLGQRNDQGTVRTDLAPKAVDAVEAQIGAEGLAAAHRLAGSVAFGPVSGDKQLYLCHVLCELGALDAVKTFRDIRDWLDRHPREVLMIIIEDAAPAAEIKRGLEEGGLAEVADATPVRPGTPLPTLGQIVAGGRRVWIAAEERGDPTGWYRRAQDLFQETPFAFASTAQLEAPSSCRPNRGGTAPPLFLVNHWVENYPPRPADASVVNRKAFILERARECARIRERTPTLLAVDFVERGDLIGAVEQLNGVAEKPASGVPQPP